MIQLFLSWFAQIGQWFTSVGQWLLTSPWFGPMAQWFMKHIMEGSFKQMASTFHDVKVRFGHWIPKDPRIEFALFGSIFVFIFVWSAIFPHDYFTWFLEVFPILIEIVLLVIFYKKFPLTRLSYYLLFFHAIILMVGGHYTYALVPLGEWMKEWFGFTRNNYDRIGHFFQGFVPAILAREILVRTSPIKKGKWLFFICCCICLAISAAYELVEWGVAEATGEASDSFLGTQGDVWDTQWDMCFALIGAIASLLLLSSIHNAQLARLKEKQHVA